MILMSEKRNGIIYAMLREDKHITAEWHQHGNRVSFVPLFEYINRLKKNKRNPFFKLKK